MSKPLLPLTVQAPGFLGLNTQQSGSVLPPGWATKLENFVFDDSGRIASRNGTKQQNGTVITSTPTVKAIHEYIDASGSVLNIVACDNKIYKEVAGTMTDISGAITTPSDDLWQFQNFNGWCIGYQSGEKPCLLDTVSGTFVDAEDFGGASTKTMFDGPMVLSAYGRAWTVLSNTLYYTDLLIHSYAGGSSGNFDLAKYWPNGMDEAVALADFNGFLVVFGKESIIVYENADDVNTMAIVEGIDGIGCPYRDSVQVVGKEIVFMSSTGLRGLGRTLVDGSMPLSDYSKNVRDKLIAFAGAETAVEVKSAYNPEKGFYLLSLPTSGLSYMFDVKLPQQDQSWRATTWDIAPTALNYTQGLKLEMAAEAGYLSEYTGWRDGDNSSGVGGAAYTIDFEGVWNDFNAGSEAQQPVGALLKIPKTVSVLASGSSGNAVVFKWALDYSSTFSNVNLSFSTASISKYNVAKYNLTDNYGSPASFERRRASLAGTGQVIKIGVFTTIDESSFALQRIDVLAKLGRIGI